MADSLDTLKWSTQLRLASASRSSKLVGDKITLPPSALEALLAAAPVEDVASSTNGHLTTQFDPFNPYSFAAERNARQHFADRQQRLPHPLTFRLVNPTNGRGVYAGIREFSADEGEVGLSDFLRDCLGLSDGHSPSKRSRAGTPSSDVETMDQTESLILTVHAKQLPKGTYVRLRPLEPGYDPEDWKSLLERYLQANFTTLTKNELLVIHGARHEQFRFLVDKFEPDTDGICIVDTDLEVDIEALNEEQARETLARRQAKRSKHQQSSTASSVGGPIALGNLNGQVSPTGYVDYDLSQWDRSKPLQIILNSETAESQLDLLVSPFSAYHRSRPREDEFLYGDISVRASKRLRLSPDDQELNDVEALYLSVHAWSDSQEQPDSTARPFSYTLTVSQDAEDSSAGQTGVNELKPDEIVCQNCQQHIPKRTLPLHEAFCYRNNIRCPQCSNVYLKTSQAWKDHWHCSYDDEYGDGPATHNKHDSIFHPASPIRCPGCDFEAYDMLILAQHRSTVCPAKEILCQFCHLVVPQQGPDDPAFTDADVLLSGLTPHELTDGARTTECHICNKIVRLRDMKTHLRLHDRDRVTRPRPNLCININCQRTIKSGDEGRVIQEQLGFCNECFGPLYVATYDPERKTLRRRIERRLVQQLIGGCGKPWCRNEQWCKTAHKTTSGEERSMSAKAALDLIKPFIEQLTKGDSAGLMFCVDEGAQVRGNLARMIAAEGEYEFEWCVRALEEGKSDLSKARDWLKDRAPKVGELVR